MVPKVVEGIPAQIVDGQIAEMAEEAEEQDDTQPDEATTLPVCPSPLCKGVQIHSLAKTAFCEILGSLGPSRLAEVQQCLCR